MKMGLLPLFRLEFLETPCHERNGWVTTHAPDVLSSHIEVLTNRNILSIDLQKIQLNITITL